MGEGKMQFAFLSVFILCSLGLLSFAGANVEVSVEGPDQEIGNEIAGINLINEAGQTVSFSSIDKTKPTLLVPFFSHCTSSCPLTMDKLKRISDQLSNKDYGVVLFDFDSSDQSADLHEFRRALKVPDSWAIYRADKNNTQGMLDSIGFRYLTQGNEFVHPSVLVVLSPDHRIMKYIKGTTYSAQNLDQAISDAAGRGKRPFDEILLVLFAIFALSLGGVSYSIRNKARSLRRNPA
jgi:protein SCO1